MPDRRQAACPTAQRNEIGNAIMNLHASGARTLSEFSVTIQDEAIRAAAKYLRLIRIGAWIR